MHFVLAMVFAGLVASPMGVSAQYEGATAEPGVQGPGRPDSSGERYEPPSTWRPADEPKKDTSLSAELRFRIFTTSFRWSSYRSGAMDLPDSGKRSLYVVPALGVRFYPKNSHGVLVDVDYRLDTDVDSDAGFLCIFDCPPQLWTEFVVAHAGYAYRYVIGKRESGRLAWTLTPHASVAAGASYSDANTGVYSYYGTVRSPVVGARFGLDVDLHIKRFFMGWTLRYEFLKHTKSPHRFSHFVSWNVIPVFAIGAVLGAKVQTQDP